MTTDPKKNDELKDKDLEGVAGGAGVQRPDETDDDDATQPTGDIGEPFPKADASRI